MKSNISRNRKIQVEFWQIKVKLVLLLYCFALANTIILHMLQHHAVSSIRKLLARFVSLLLFLQKKYEMQFLHSWEPSFCATSYISVLAMYTTTRIVLFVHIAICHRTLSESQGSPGLEFSLLYLPHNFDSFYTLPHQKYRLSSFPMERPPRCGNKKI